MGILFQFKLHGMEWKRHFFDHYYIAYTKYVALYQGEERKEPSTHHFHLHLRYPTHMDFGGQVPNYVHLQYLRVCRHYELFSSLHSISMATSHTIYQ